MCKRERKNHGSICERNVESGEKKEREMGMRMGKNS